MKKLALAVAAMALALGGTSAKADLFDYGQLYGGVTIEPPLDSSGQSDMGTGLNVGGALGWNLGPDFSADVDFMFTKSDYDTPGFCCTLETFSFMANIYYNFDFGSKWKPFVGVGAGGIQVLVDSENVGGVSDSDIVFGYQAMAGFTIQVADTVDFLAEYKYQGANDATINVFGSPYSQEYKSNNISAGLRFHL